MKKIRVYRVRCLRCGYVWVPEKEEVKVCAKCHSPYWNTKKTKFSKSVKVLKTNDDNP